MEARAPLFTPIQRDVLWFFGPLFVVLGAIGIAVGFGLDLSSGGLVFAPWALVMLVLGFLVFAASVVWHYQVYRDEREPARGEFTLDPETGAVREGRGSYRRKALTPEALAEPHQHMEETYVPRTRARWILWAAVFALCLGLAAFLVRLGDTTADPLAFHITATALVAVALVLGALIAGDFGHWGRWTRRS